MSIPKELLKDLYWSFRARFADKASFEEELMHYNARLSKYPQLDKIVFPEQKIVIQYQWIPFDDENDEDRYIFLETENAKGFTLSELMFKINNTAITENENDFDLSDQDAHFFEGLEYVTDDDPEYPQTKVYFMILGS